MKGMISKKLDILHFVLKISNLWSFFWSLKINARSVLITEEKDTYVDVTYELFIVHTENTFLILIWL